jgi:hypothetical protein
VGLLHRIYYYDFPEPQLLEYEILTRFPIKKLVNIICKFYWSKGHKTITLIRHLNDGDKTYEDYNPLTEIENPDSVSQINVHTRKEKKKELKFDLILIEIKKETFKTKITWNVDIGSGTRVIIYVAFAFITSFYCALKLSPEHDPDLTTYLIRKYTFGLYAVLIFAVLTITPYYAYYFKIRWINSHQSTEKYKMEFEQHIREKEKELFPGLY